MSFADFVTCRNVSSFFTAYVGIPLFLVIYLGHRFTFWSDGWAYDPLDVDLQTGLTQVLADEKPVKTIVGPWYKKLSVIWQ